ncbi:hypothetical protein H6F77_10835 [Microcoleus sp. FACHB-831]|jgi:hypothetical protein|uniref:hypothetical protein n=1 Tax=Microcoleus sp. FACHB-831 TaxID=2692827 RepID=UPI00168A13C5|nr:hypothetical protein [Microcoleus sp. FACHB-831]MBD1921586.1 hypothetical protein [Microcoleus sp. FACHB-831]
MQVQICLLQAAIAELFASVAYTRCITLADRYGLLAALLQDSLSPEEAFSIDRLLHAVRRGRLKMVDEISAVL